MIIAIQNTIGAIRSFLGTVMSGLNMWLPFSSSQQLGEELVVNGDFADGTTNWSEDGVSTISVGTHQGKTNVANINIGNIGLSRIEQSFDYVNGKQYEVSVEVYLVNGSFRVDSSDSFVSGDFVSTTTTGSWQTLTATITAIQTGTNVIWLRSISQVSEFYVNSISVKEVGQFSLDETTNNNDAKLLTGNCLDFDGTNDYLDIDGFTMSGTNATFAFWVNPDTNVNTYILDANPNRLVIAFNSGQISLYSGGWFIFGVLTQNVWNRVVIVINETTAKCFVNGVQLGVNKTITAINIASATDVKIGSRYNGDSLFFKGQLSDFQIWDAAWSDTDVANDYAEPNEVVSSVPTVNLVGYWAMTEGNGGLAYDSSSLLSEEIIVNGDFETNSDWSLININLTYNPTVFTNTAFNGKAIQSFTTVVGASYKVSFEITSGTWNVMASTTTSAGGSLGNVQGTTSGSFNFIATGTTTRFIAFLLGSSGTTGLISGASVKQVTPADNGAITNGATWLPAQSTIPQLGMMDWSKGSNLMTYSEDFSEWTSSASNTLVSGFISPLGDASAYKISGTSTTVLSTSVDATGRTRSVYARTVSGTGTANLMTFNGNGDVFNLTETWQRFEVTGWIGSGASNFYLTDFRGTGSLSEFLVWGAQEVVGTSAGNYRKTNGTAVTNAILPPYPVNPTTDVLGNTLRARLNSLNLTGTGYGEVADDNSLDFGTGDFSVEAWAKWDFVNSGSSYNTIYSNGGLVTATSNFGLVTSNPNKIRFLVNNTSCLSTSTFSNGDWVHIVGTRESGSLKLYINGNKTPEATASNSDTVTNALVKSVGKDAQTFRFYHNLIDDVRVYNRAILATEVEQNYKAGLSAHTN